jgi:long-chain acyl-CoA synthetase
VLLNGISTNPEVIVKEANQTLADYQRMNLWFVWPENDFPRTATWKPRRNLIALAVERQLQQKVSSNTAPTQVAELIARITGQIPNDLRSDANLESDLNLSSLDRVELLSTLEDQYQIDLTDTSFSAARTIGDLERMLQGEAAPRAHYDYPCWVLRWPITWIRLAVHYLLLRPAVFLLGWPHIEGRDNLRDQTGPLLVICNHIGDIDPGFVLTALPAHFRHKLAIATGGEALQKLRTPPKSRNVLGRGYDQVKWGLGVSLLNLFPLPREAGFRESFEYAGECMDRGFNVLVFPEGHHTIDGKLKPFFPGIGLLATRLGVPVVPMRIDGLFETKQAGKKFAWPGQIRVKIGIPVQFQTDDSAERIAKELEIRVAGL